MPNPTDVVEGLRALVFRATEAAIRAFIEQSTKSRASPMETCERLVALERRDRDSKNLERRTRFATLGSFTTLERFDWNHPRSIDRALYEEQLDLDFVERGENVLLRGQAEWARRRSPRTSASPRWRRATPCASPPSPAPSRTS